MRLAMTLVTLFFGFQASAQHQHQTPPDTSKIPSNLKEAFSSADPMVQEIRKGVIKQLYNGLIHPAPIAVLSGEKPVTDIFQEGVVQGRVSPAGSYSDFTSAMEYFYALAETPITHVDDIQIRSLVASDDKVAVEVDLHFCRSPFNCDTKQIAGPNVFTLKEMGFFT